MSNEPWCAICNQSTSRCKHRLDMEEHRAIDALAGGYRHWRYDQPQLQAPWEADPRVRSPWEQAHRRKANR